MAFRFAEAFAAGSAWSPQRGWRRRSAPRRCPPDWSHSSKTRGRARRSVRRMTFIEIGVDDARPRPGLLRGRLRLALRARTLGQRLHDPHPRRAGGHPRRRPRGLAYTSSTPSRTSARPWTASASSAGTIEDMDVEGDEESQAQDRALQALSRRPGLALWAAPAPGRLTRARAARLGQVVGQVCGGDLDVLRTSPGSTASSSAPTSTSCPAPWKVEDARRPAVAGGELILCWKASRMRSASGPTFVMTSVLGMATMVPS